MPIYDQTNPFAPHATAAGATDPQANVPDYLKIGQAGTPQQNAQQAGAQTNPYGGFGNMVKALIQGQQQYNKSNPTSPTVGANGAVPYTNSPFGVGAPPGGASASPPMATTGGSPVPTPVTGTPNPLASTGGGPGPQIGTAGGPVVPPPTAPPPAMPAPQAAAMLGQAGPQSAPMAATSAVPYAPPGAMSPTDGAGWPSSMQPMDGAMASQLPMGLGFGGW